jgi:uncharacterized repeat protein (TIGR01451 family)
MKRALFTIALVALALALGAGPALASEANGLRRPHGFEVPVQTIPICHATGDPARPYDTPPTVVEILVFGELSDGHSDHPGDIIPPYIYYNADGTRDNFIGQNFWFGPGGVIYQNDCVPPTPPTPDPDPITPATECVELLAGGGFRAHFGYQNPNDAAVQIPVGSDNAFSPGDADRGQPTDFLPGSHGDVVQVESVGGAPLTWTVTGNAATASVSSPKCQGSITITKLLNPSDDPGRFNLEIDGESVRAEGPAGDGDTTGAIAVTAATHTVGESGAGTDLWLYDIQIVCRTSAGAGDVVAASGSASVQVAVRSGEALVCTITNTRKIGPGPGPQPVTPVLECVVINAAGPDVAVWGYENPNDHAVEIDIGNANAFSPGDQDRGQPTTFEPGGFAAVFQTPFEAGAGALTWTLTGNTATASSSSPPCTQPLPPDPSPPGAVDLELKKTASPTTVRVGGLITWTMTVTNRSTVAVADVSGARVVDRLFGMEMVSLTTSQGTCSPPDGCNLGRLHPGGSVTVTAVTKATQVGEVVNCVRVGSEEIESSYLNNTACAVAHVTGRAAPILDGCRSLFATPRLLRAERESIVLVTAHDLLGRPLAGVSILARGPGVRALDGTNARGIARFVITPTRLGIIRFRGVGPGTATITALGCRTRMAVLPPRQPPPLTGRSD